MKRTSLFILILFAWINYVKAQVAAEDKHRLIVTTDLGGSDPDDIQSMIHLLVCSNVIDIEGLISSQAWVDGPDKTAKILEVVEQFGEVLPTLNKHAEGYPDLNRLRAIVNVVRLFPIWMEWGRGKIHPGRN